MSSTKGCTCVLLSNWAWHCGCTFNCPCSTLAFRLLHNEPVLCCSCGACFIATFLYIKVHPGFFVFLFLVFCFFFRGEWGEIALVPLSVHKAAVVLHWDPELNYFLYFRMSRLPSIEQCRQKSDKQQWTNPLRQYSWTCMVSFPRRRGNKNAHFVHHSVQMRDERYGMVKWHTSRNTRG